MKTPQQKKRFGAVKKALTTASVCTTLAGCPGAQVRPPPEPKPCPPGAVEAMKARRIPVGSGLFEPATLRLEGEEPGIRTISGSWISVVYIGGWKALRGFTLSGELIIGERRVYGRLTQARKGSETFPICMELVEGADWKRGVARDDDDRSPNTAKIHSTVQVRAVDHFE